MSFPPLSFPSFSASSEILDFSVRLRQSPFDVGAVSSILKALTNVSIESARPYYEELVRYYPSSGLVWLYWITHEIRSGSGSNVENLFQRSLLRAIDLPLWLIYLDHIEAQNPISPISAEETPSDIEVRESRIRAVHEGFEFVFKHFFHEFQIGTIFRRFLAFLKSKPTRNSYEESAKNNEIRKAFQRIIAVPCNLVEEFWREYDTFEHAINKTLAKSLLAEWQPKHIQAKSVARERKKKRIGLNLSFIPTPPPSSTPSSVDSFQGPRGQLAHAEQLFIWKRIIAHEASNPQRLSTSEVRSRLYFHYRQAINFLRHYPDLWLEFAQFTAEIPLQADEASGILKEATAAMASNPSAGPFMAFLWAEFEEERKNFPAARAIYEELIAEYSRRADDAADSNRSIFAGYIPLLYIQLMRFARRAEGPDSARKIFIGCRKSPHCSWLAYDFAAEQELRCNSAPAVASKIFSFALQAFPNEESLKVKYLKFLAQTGDLNNYRVHMEKFCKAAETAEIAAMAEFKKKRGAETQWPTPLALAKNLWEFGLTQTSPGSDLTIVPGGRVEEFTGAPQSNLEDSLQMIPSNISPSGHIFHLAVEFERWTATDIATVQRAEQRREIALGLQSPRTAIAADRQRFLSLWPCSVDYRQVLQLSMKVSAQQLPLSIDSTHAAMHRIGLKAAIRPDFTRLIQFQPHFHSVDPGRFRFVPQGIVKLIEAMPGPEFFTGPRYSNEIINYFQANPTIPLNEQTQLQWELIESMAPQESFVAPIVTNGDSNQENPADVAMNPTTDIYKLRQQQKHKIV